MLILFLSTSIQWKYIIKKAVCVTETQFTLPIDLLHNSRFDFKIIRFYTFLYELLPLRRAKLYRI